MCPANPSKKEPYCQFYNYNKIQNTDCENCTSWKQIYRDFISENPGNENTISILLTGNKLYNDDGSAYNRSFAWYNNGIVIQEIYNNSSLYLTKTLAVLVHEIAHQIGAPDHYHEMITNEDGTSTCRCKELCSKCGSNPRDSSCIMYSARKFNLLTCDLNEIFCLECYDDIIEHLKEHHIEP